MNRPHGHIRSARGPSTKMAATTTPTTPVLATPTQVQEGTYRRPTYLLIARDIHAAAIHLHNRSRRAADIPPPQPITDSNIITDSHPHQAPLSHHRPRPRRAPHRCRATGQQVQGRHGAQHHRQPIYHQLQANPSLIWRIEQEPPKNKCHDIVGREQAEPRDKSSPWRERNAPTRTKIQAFARSHELKPRFTGRTTHIEGDGTQRDYHRLNGRQQRVRRQTKPSARRMRTEGAWNRC